MISLLVAHVIADAHEWQKSLKKCNNKKKWKIKNEPTKKPSEQGKPFLQNLDENFGKKSLHSSRA